MASESKGSAIALLKGRGVKLGAYAIKLREPAALQESTANSPETLNTCDPDPCCGKRIAQALNSGKLKNVDSWVCPQCGEVWEAEAIGPLRHWSPRPLMEWL
jgi:hypothetical protein